MIKLFTQFLDRLGSPKEQNSENVALAVVYCMYLSFSMVLIVMMLLAL
jgi:hypothetical protein